MSKRIITAIFCLLFSLLWPCAALAQAGAEPAAAEQAAGRVFYVAGNPDLYPIEYYDGKTMEYRGILPEIYKRLSAETGMDFVYVRGGEFNEQAALARNRQVDIVSAHLAGSIEGLAGSVRLVAFRQGGEEMIVNIGFTDLMPGESAEQIIARLQGISDSELLALSLSNVSRGDRSSLLPWLCGIILFLAIVVLILAILSIRLRRRVRRMESSELVDPLTGIGNEQYFRENYGHFIIPSTYSLYYIVYVSLQLPRIETFFGSDAAQELERFAANTLANGVADSDFVSRLDDGVFLLAVSATSPEAVTAKITAFVNKLNAYERIDLHYNKTLFRAGIFHLPSANTPFETAYANAKQGYQLAEDNKTCVEMVSSSLLSAQAKKSRLQKTIADALANREFKMYLQFVVDAGTQKIVGAEALSRWHNKREGVLKPARYIEAMHASGLIEELDFYMFEQVCKMLDRRTRDKADDLWISCNFARTSVSSAGFCRRLEDIAGKYGFPREQLVIEITEDSLTDNPEVIYQNLSYCKKAGYRLALDDFGSGYSSFNDLFEYPIDIIKIDRHITSKFVTERGRALLAGITSLARGLGMEVLCEGVETKEEFEMARSIGCVFVQGYYSSRVLPCDEAEDYYRKHS